eukprot:1459073-Rhodomonas_salina.4
MAGSRIVHPKSNRRNRNFSPICTSNAKSHHDDVDPGWAADHKKKRNCLPGTKIVCPRCAVRDLRAHDCVVCALFNRLVVHGHYHVLGPDLPG